MSLIAEKYKKKAAVIGQTFQDFRLVGNVLVPLSDDGRTIIRQGYDVNDIVYSIVNLILDKVRIAPWAVYKVKDESSLKRLHGLMAKKDLTGEDYRNMLSLRSKSFDVVKNPGKLGDLLKYPNERDTFQDFIANGCGFKLLTGNKYVWGRLIPGGANKGMPNELINMPSQYTVIYNTGGIPAKVLRYEIPIMGNASYDPLEILHEAYMNYDFTVNGTQLMGRSPFKSASKRINNSNSGMDVSTAKFQNGGMEGIIHYDGPNPDGEGAMPSMTALKDKLTNEYSGPHNAGKLGVSGYKVGFINVGYTPVELDLIKADINNLRFLSNVVGVPSQILNDPENKSFNNSKEGEKALTTRCALPLLTSARDNLNRKFTADWGMDKSWLIDFDLSVFSELQESVGESLRWMQPLLLQGWPLNRALATLNIETVPQPEFDEPWITPAMGQPYSEWKISPVEAALDTDDNALNSGL